MNIARPSPLYKIAGNRASANRNQDSDYRPRTLLRPQAFSVFLFLSLSGHNYLTVRKSFPAGFFTPAVNVPLTSLPVFLAGSPSRQASSLLGGSLLDEFPVVSARYHPGTP